MLLNLALVVWWHNAIKWRDFQCQLLIVQTAAITFRSLVSVTSRKKAIANLPQRRVRPRNVQFVLDGVAIRYGKFFCLLVFVLVLRSLSLYQILPFSVFSLVVWQNRRLHQQHHHQHLLLSTVNGAFGVPTARVRNFVGESVRR